MKKTKLLAIFLAVSLLLCACGGATMAENGAPMDKGYDTGANRAELPSTEVLDKESSVSQSALPANQKLIRKIWLEAETEDLQTLLSSVEARIAELQGYVEGRQVRNGSAYSGKRYRYAELTIRIPADQLDSFVSDVSKHSNITNTRETTDDVTLSYVEHESRVLALETEHTRLLELLAKAETMDDILKIDSRLTDIRSQLETVKSQLRVYDNLVNYGTVYLNITEVTEFTPVTQPQTIWERMGTGITESWKDMVEGLEDALVFVVTALPHLLPLAVIGAVVVTVLHLLRKKKTKKTPPKATEEK